MGKKNKKQTVNNDTKSPEKTKPQGGSAIVKGKPQNAATNKQNNKSPQKGAQPNQKAVNKPANKNVNAPKKIPDEKLQVAAAAVAAKSAKKKNKNKKKGATNGDVKKDDNASKAVETPKTDSPVVLTKRDKSRLKSEINREIILKGKSKLGLADPKLVAKKLAKLKNKAEPHSKKAQRKILLLDSLLKRLTKGQKLDTKKEIDETEAIMNGSDSDSSDDDEKMSEDDVKPNKVNGKSEPATPAKAKKIEYTVFVGGLPETITKEAVKEHFQQAGIVIKAKVPPPKKKKSNKRFAYVQLIDEPARQKALQLHGTMIADKKISVLYADKSKGRKELMSLNAKLGALRKTESDQTPGSSPNEKTKKNKNKKKGNKKSPFLK